MGNKRMMVFVTATAMVFLVAVVAFSGNRSQIQKVVPIQPIAPSEPDPLTFCGSHWIDELQTVVHGSCLYGETKPAPMVNLPPVPVPTPASASFHCRGVWDEWMNTIVDNCSS